MKCYACGESYEENSDKITELEAKIKELEKENLKAHGWIAKAMMQGLNEVDCSDELLKIIAKRDLQSKIEAVNHIISHDSAKCRSKRSVDCNAIHLADLYNYAIYLEQQLRQQAKGGDV